MATTEQPAALTEQHRLAQIQVQAAALRDFTRLWPIWKGDRDTFATLVQATQPLVTVYRQSSSSLASSYYQAARAAEGVAGDATVRLAAPLSPSQLAASMYATGMAATRGALSASRTPQAVNQTAFVRTSGAVTRQVLDAGRGTILNSVAADAQATGWARVTDGNPCAFCLMLASRGAVYKTEQTADFQAHDHCGCTVAPLWKGSALPEQTTQWQTIYGRSQYEAVQAGELKPGRNPSAARLNAVRRYLAANPVQ